MQPNSHSFFTAIYKILKLSPSGHSIFLQCNTKFWKLYQRPLIYFINETRKFKNCTQTGICFFTAKYKSLTTETQNFEKLYPTGHLFFPQENKEIKLFISNFFENEFLKKLNRDILLHFWHLKNETLVFKFLILFVFYNEKWNQKHYWTLNIILKNGNNNILQKTRQKSLQRCISIFLGLFLFENGNWVAVNGAIE